ncbi:MAG: GNAT family N-acetyltransferase [Pseudohongiella sp.]
MTACTEVCLRRSVPSHDAPFLFALYIATRRQEVASWGWSDAQTRDFLSMQWELQKKAYDLQYPDACDMLIMCGREASGRCLIQESANILHLIDIALLPEFRGLGIGSHVLQLLQRAATERCIPLKLSVAMNNSAQDLYRRHGFYETYSSETHIAMQWQPSVAVNRNI